MFQPEPPKTSMVPFIIAPTSDHPAVLPSYAKPALKILWSTPMPRAPDKFVILRSNSQDPPGPVCSILVISNPAQTWSVPADPQYA